MSRVLLSPVIEPTYFDHIKIFNERRIGSAAVHEVQGQAGRLPKALRPIAQFDPETVANIAARRLHEHWQDLAHGADPDQTPFYKVLKESTYMAGPAVTCRIQPGDNLFIHAAVEQCFRGAVLVVGSTDPEKHLSFGNLGDLLATQLLHESRKVAGVVIDGSCRDISALLEMGIPVFIRQPCIQGTTKSGPAGDVNYSITLGKNLKTKINPGDLIVGDVDGLVAVPRGKVFDVLDGSLKRLAKEETESRPKYKGGDLSLNSRGMRDLIKQLGEPPAP